MALKVIIYVLAGMFGFAVTYYGMQWLRSVFFQSLKKGKYNPIFAILYMLIGGTLLFLPALYDIWAFLVCMIVSVMTNIILIFTLNKTKKTLSSDQTKENI